MLKVPIQNTAAGTDGLRMKGAKVNEQLAEKKKKKKKKDRYEYPYLRGRKAQNL